MAQKTILSLLALPTGPPRTFSAKTAFIPQDALSGALTVVPAFICALTATPAFSGSLVVTPAFTAELSVTNVSS